MDPCPVSCPRVIGSSPRDRAAGCEWAFSLAQFEASDTAVFDQPLRARSWFEAAIGDHFDLGRPERVCLLVDPGSCITRVLASSQLTSTGRGLGAMA